MSRSTLFRTLQSESQAPEFRYTPEMMPGLLHTAVHGTPPLRETSNQEGGRPYRDPSHLGDEIAERVDVMNAWKRVPAGPLEDLYWAVVVDCQPVSMTARRFGVNLGSGTVAIEEGSKWLAFLMNNKHAR